MRDLIFSPFSSIRAFAGYVLIFIAPIWALISFLGSVDFVMSYAEPIVSVLHSWWGVIALIVVGFALLAWDSHKRQSGSTSSPSHTGVNTGEPAAPPPTSSDTGAQDPSTETPSGQYRETLRRKANGQREIKQEVADAETAVTEAERNVLEARIGVLEEQLRQSELRSRRIPEHMISERRIHYRESPTRLADLLEVAGDNGVLRDFSFEHCILEGPGIISLEGPFPKSETEGSGTRASLAVGPAHCRVEGSPDATLYQVARGDKMPVGVIHLSGYTLRSVTFRGLGFAGTPDHLEWLKEHLIFSEGNSA